MKRLLTMTMLSIALLGAGNAAYAAEETALKAQEITHEQSSRYERMGNISITQNGFSMENDRLAAAVAEKGGKYYVITGQQGETNHQTIEAQMFK